jgi:hypothetical protein
VDREQACTGFVSLRVSIQARDAVDTAVTSRILKSHGIIYHLSDYQLLNKDPSPWR